MQFIYKTQPRFLFHAHIKIKVPDCYEDEVLDRLFAVMEEVDRKYNSYQPDSYFDRINKNAGNFVEVDDEGITLLKEVLRLSAFFDGRYDITIMPLLKLWGFYEDGETSVPSEDRIQEIIPLIDYSKIRIDGNKVKIEEGQEIITGSFLKAYAVDKVIKVMREMKMNDGLINAGGSSISCINNDVHPFWQVEVNDPENARKLFTVFVGNKSYSTSSQSVRTVDIDGHPYGHILNPVTGYPAINKQVGVICESCMAGDIISTGLMNETSEGFLERVTQLSQRYPVEGYIIDAEGRITYTREFKKYLNM